MTFRILSNNLPLKGVEAQVWILTLFFWLIIATCMLYCCQNFQSLDYIDQRYGYYLSIVIQCSPILSDVCGTLLQYRRWVQDWLKHTRTGAKSCIWWKVASHFSSVFLYTGRDSHTTSMSDKTVWSSTNILKNPYH